MSTQPAQSRTIRAQLLSDMREGRYAACERLPRESVLAEKLGISRTQLRDVLASWSERVLLHDATVLAPSSTAMC